MKRELTLLVGTYTDGGEFVPSACGEGIVVCGMDLDTGHITRRSAFEDILNPSYLACDNAGRQIFAVSEDFHQDGSVWQFSLDSNNALVPVAKQESRGAACCHVAILPGNRIASASYFGGCASVFPVTNGTLAAAQQAFTYEGTGPNTQRQEASHAHQVVVAPNERWFYVCDLGADRVWQHDLTALDREPTGLPMPAGLGPRHMAYHPSQPRAYVLGELTGSIAVCDWSAESGVLSVVSTTEPVEENAGAAAIWVHPGSRTLWISLRGKPALRVLPLDSHGRPGEATHIPLADGEPRDFAITPDGRWLVVAAQSANELVVIGLDPATGLPDGSPHQHFPMNTPVAVTFI